MTTREERKAELESINRSDPNMIFQIYRTANGGSFGDFEIGTMASKVIEMILDLEFPTNGAPEAS